MSGVMDWSLVPAGAGFIFKSGQVVSEALSSAANKNKTSIPIPNDFFSSTLSLGMLQFYTIGTKVFLDGTRFSLHTRSWKQSVHRWWYADGIVKQADVAKAIALFAVFFPPQNSEDAKMILELAKEGLVSLKKTYEDEKDEKEKDTALGVIARWNTLIDKALEGPIVIEGLTEEKKVFFNIIGDSWKNQLSIIVNIFKEAKRKQMGMDPDTEIRCDSELSYLISLQEKQNKQLPDTFEAKLLGISIPV